MCPQRNAVPPCLRNVLVDYDDPVLSQDAADLVQNNADVLRMVEHVTQQDGVERAVIRRDALAVV